MKPDFDLQEVLDAVGWYKDLINERDSDNVIILYRCPDVLEAIDRPDLPFCPLFTELERLCEAMGITRGQLTGEGQLGFCGYRLLRFEANIREYCPCVTIIEQFGLMLNFTRNTKQARSEKQKVEEDMRLRVGDCGSSRELREIADLMDRVKQRKYCRSQLEQSFPQAGKARQFVNLLKEELGLSDKKKLAAPAEPAAIRREPSIKAQKRAATIPQDPFCLFLRQQQSQPTEAAVV